jgi:5'-nucleotidase
MKKFRSKLLITFGLIGTFIIIISFKTEKTHKSSNQTVKDTLSITVLQTADIHGQLDTHPELFWENEEIVFKNRGGLANIKTLFERERKMNPGKTLIVDGGDLIQGSGYAALSEGKVIPDIIKIWAMM